MPRNDDSQTSTPRRICTDTPSAVPNDSCHATMSVSMEAADAVAMSKEYFSLDFLALIQNASATAAQRNTITAEMRDGYHLAHQPALSGWYASSNKNAEIVLTKNHGSFVW